MKKFNDKKMKIAFVSDAIYPYNKGGKEKRIYEISTRLAKRGHNVHIYCMKWWKGEENNRIENGVHLHAISKYYPLYSGKRRSIKEALMFSLACFKLIREDFDIIDADHMPHLVLFPLKIVCLIKRKKLIASWNEVWGKKYWKEYLGKLGFIAYVIEKLSVLMPDKIISISEHTTNKLKNDLSSKKEIATIPIGVDFDHIQKIKPSPVKSDVIFAGRLLAHKNVDVLIKSIALIKKSKPNIRCLIIGEGPEKQKLEELSRSLNLTESITFLNFIEKHDDLYALMKSSKVFVLPSIREGFGIVVIEANSCGIKVITSDLPDNAARDLILNKLQNGYLCKSRVSDFSETIIRSFKNSLKAMDITVLSKLFSWNEVTNITTEFYSI